MNHLSKFYALSAIYFGLASAVGAQPASTLPEPPAPRTTEDAHQGQFEHPMLEQRSGSDMRPADDEGRRIQRRGLPDTRRDGDMQRNVLPGAADAEDGPVLERDTRDRYQAPGDRRRTD